MGLLAGQQGSRPALNQIVHMLKTTGTLTFLALLHGMPAIFDAAHKNVLTGEDVHPPPEHWATVAQRMGFSRQQKLHFKLALQNFRRQARVTSTRGLSVLQETPSYAFLMACQFIASRQPSSSNEGSPNPAGPREAAAQPSRGNTAADASGARSSSHAGRASRAAAGSAGDSGPAGGSRAGTSGGTAAGGAGSRAGAGAGDCSASGSALFATAAAAAAAARGSSPAHGTAGPQPHQQQQEEAPAVADVDEGPSCPMKRLQHQVGLYCRQIVNLNIFLVNSLTLEQLLVLNVASYPFWPNLSAVAEAALQLPDNEDLGPQEELHGVQVLMQKRRSFMQHAHYQWWSDYGQPGAQLPPE